jgi:preprotein translocase subunit SecG
MFITPLLASVTVSLLAIAFVFICVFMMLVILIQKPKGGGLSGAFGGAGGGESSFVGAKVGDFLTYLTVGCFVAFLLLAMGLTWTINPTENLAKRGAVAAPETTTAPLDDDAAAAPADDAPPAGAAATPPTVDGPTGPTEQAVDLVSGDDEAEPSLDPDAAE